jgi:hypothetical protein
LTADADITLAACNHRADIDALSEIVAAYECDPGRRREHLRRLVRVALSLMSDIRPHKSGVASRAATAAPVKISLLGTFSVTVDRATTPLSQGNAADLVALLATQESGTVIDQAVDALWPDVTLDVGRRRLRNVVSRCRKMLGVNAIVRRGDHLSVGPEVFCDVAEFRRLANRATTAIARNDDEASRLAIATLDSYGGQLLPTHLYTDWAEWHRVALRSTGQAIFRALVEGTLRRPHPAWLLHTAVRLDIDDPELLGAIADDALNR